MQVPPEFIVLCAGNSLVPVKPQVHFEYYKNNIIAFCPGRQQRQSVAVAYYKYKDAMAWRCFPLVTARFMSPKATI